MQVLLDGSEAEWAGVAVGTAAHAVGACEPDRICHIISCCLELRGCRSAGRVRGVIGGLR